MVRAGGLFALAMSCACITVPELPDRAGDAAISPDADAAIGSDADSGAPDSDGGVAAPDAGDRCELFAAGAGRPLSGALFEVHLRRPQIVADVNCDGRDDVLISNHGTDLVSRGVIVFLGREQGFATQFDDYVSTKIDENLGIDPYAIHLERGVGDDNKLDLLVLGNDTGPGAQNRILLSVYFGLGQADDVFGFQRLTKIFTETAQVLSGGDRNTSQPVWLASGNFDGDAFPDLIAGDLTKVFTLNASRPWDGGFNSLAATAYTRDGAPWENALEARPIRWSRTTADDLLIAGTYDLTFAANDGAGGFDSTPQIFPIAAPGHRSHAIIDMDQSGRPDIVGVAADTLSILRINHAASGPPLGAELLPYSTALPFMDATADEMWVEDLGGGETPEIILLDRETTPNLPRLFVIGDPSLGTTTVTSTRTVSQTISSFDPLLLTVADTNGDREKELWLWARDGSTRCYRYLATEFPSIEPCP